MQLLLQILKFYFYNVTQVDNHYKYCIITKIILDYQVMMFHDEKVVETQPACGQMMCSLDQFRQAYQYLADLDFEEECKI